MSKPIEITVNYGRTINMGNYESFRIDVTERRQLQEGENSEQVIRDTRNWLRALAVKMIKEEGQYIRGERGQAQQEPSVPPYRQDEKPRILR